MQTQINQQAGEEFQATLDFMRNHQFHGSSKFSPYERDIAFLIGQGFTQAKVAFWLAAPPRNVVAARSELSAMDKRGSKAGEKGRTQSINAEAGWNKGFARNPTPTAQLPGSTAAPFTCRPSVWLPQAVLRNHSPTRRSPCRQRRLRTLSQRTSNPMAPGSFPVRSATHSAGKRRSANGATGDHRLHRHGSAEKNSCLLRRPKSRNRQQSTGTTRIRLRSPHR